MKNVREKSGEEVVNDGRQVLAHIRTSLPKRSLRRRLAALIDPSLDEFNDAALEYIVRRVVEGTEAYLNAQTAPEEQLAMHRVMEAYSLALAIKKAVR